MDPEKPIEDQFSRRHPCFPVNTKIGIVGAGPSGLSAAYALTKLGYSNVTVLEKNPSVGGMCESVEIEGKMYDLGGQVLAANSAPVIFNLAKEIGAETEEMDFHKFATIDSSTGKYEDAKVVDDYVSIISLTLKLQDEAKASGRIGVHALSDIASDLAPAFLKGHGFRSVPKSVAYGFTASGYGYVQDMPYAYIHEFTRTSMAGKIRRFKGGYTSVWQKMSESLPIKVHCNAEVLAVRRKPAGISVDVNHGNGEKQVTEFDKIIISGAFPVGSGKTYRSPSQYCNADEKEPELVDMSELETELFSKVHTIDYYTTVLKITRLEHIPMGFYYFREFMDDPAAIGHPVAMQRFYADTDVFLFWSYGNSANIQGPKVTELAVNTVRRMGGKVEKVILQRRFKYFPHVNSEDMKNGFYDKLEYQLQGQQNTYFVGGLMAFELTERNSSYAMALVRNHFSNDNPLPDFPYMKRLFPLESNCQARISKPLDELPGVEFPNLSSLDGYLRHWGTNNVTQKKTLYTWINDRGEMADERTYGELHANASHIARKLLTSQNPIIKPGDRVLLVYVPGLDFIEAFFGCLRARVVPVPGIPPDPLQRGGQALLHIQNIAKACDAVGILSTFGYHTSIRAASVKNMILMTGKGKCSPQWPDLPWCHTDSWIRNFKSLMHQEDITKQDELKPDDLCFLQFTSGSTGDAKGVMISHRGLIHNVKLMRKRYKSTSRTVLVSWLPQYHDMGLIGGLFTTMVSGGTGILFSPGTFIKKPLLWLQTMSKYQATHSAGPNFAFELIVRRLETSKVKQNFNLSSMVFLMVAAEPVRLTTLKRFIELTQPFGFSQEVIAPGYGLAENCVYASSAFGEGQPIFVDWQGRICCGYVDPNEPEVDIRIVDPETGKEHQEPGKEGEIWISSPSAGIGYWGREELSQKTFSNVLQNHCGKKYTRTGDLGRVITGKLFITGRIKDLIIVAGRNIYPSDVEKTVESSSDFLRPGCCAVVGVPEEILLAKGLSVPESSDQVGLVVIAEVREDQPCPKEVTEQIQIRVAEEHGITFASIVLIKPRTISKTTSGKIKRFECLKQFTDGTLNVIKKLILEERFSVQSMRKASQIQVTKTPLSTDPEIRKKEIIDFLKGLLLEQTGTPIANISITESLVSYGVDSIGVVRAAQKLSSFLGVPVGAIDIFTATCIEDLANFAEDLLMKSQPKFVTPSSQLHEIKINSPEIAVTVPVSHKLVIWFLQILALVYISFILTFPAYLSISAFTTIITASDVLIDRIPWFGYLISLACAPLAWVLCILSTCTSIAFFGNSFMQPNYTQNPQLSIWSVAFVKWWALYKAQEVSSKVLAVHLRGTVFLKYWYEILGAKIGSSVLLDTVDITDPFLVSIGDGAVIAEGALVQSHEVKNGILNFYPIRIGQNSSVGPYAVIHKGSIVADGAEVSALQMTGSKSMSKTAKAHYVQEDELLQKKQKRNYKNSEAIYHFLGIYIVSLLSTSSAAIVYFIWLWLSEKPSSVQIFSFCCIFGAFHWLPFAVVAYATMLDTTPSSAVNFAFSVAIVYLAHGLILSFLTCTLNCVLSNTQTTKKTNITMWLRQRIIISCHLRFGKFLSGTEAFCIYLRLLGAKIGQHCSIRAINPISNPELISIGDGVHLGDFSRIIPGFYSLNGFISRRIEVQDNSVVGSQGVILPGSVIQKDVILGALSVAPICSVLQRGGVFVGSHSPVMVKNIMHSLDDRIEEMDMKYKKVLGNLAANLAATTMKVRSRYFHRIGAAGKGFLRIYKDIADLPEHKIFGQGKKYPILIRHSNCLSSDDDARLDPRGAAIRIFSDENGCDTPILDLTLKTGKAFHARSIGDFATWLICGVAAREEHVKHAPHVREAMWDSLRQADSYAELHYYSNICRLFRFNDGTEMYVKFKLRPFDEKISEDSGKVEPRGTLPPETGAIPRSENDTRPLLFLDEDFQRRMNSPEKVRYVLQLQIRTVPQDEGTRDTALDCTKPWDETVFPYIEVGEITIDQILSKEESEELEFNPFLRCHEVDVIRATSCSQSASMDHGRSVVYSICQHLRNKKPLPEAWRIFLDQSDVKIDLSGCPMAASMEKKETKKVTLARTWYQSFWSISVQPFLQTFVPYFLMGLVIFAPLNCLFYFQEVKKLPLQWLLPVFWVCSGIIAGLTCAGAKWVLVGKKKEGETLLIWSKGIFMDTIWQAIRTLVGEYFMEMTSGSVLFALWMKLMGSDICWDQGVYVDSMGAVLNPEMVRIEEHGSVGREALLFGHIYEGEGGKVKYGSVRIGNGGFVGSRAVAMPGVSVGCGGSLGTLSLAMKGEFVN